MVNLSVPVSDVQIGAKLGGERVDAPSRCSSDVVGYARDKGLEVAVGGEDSSRADVDFLTEIVGVAKQAGARRFRIADTLSVLDPFHASFQLMAELRALDRPRTRIPRPRRSRPRHRQHAGRGEGRRHATPRSR